MSGSLAVFWRYWAEQRPLLGKGNLHHPEYIQNEALRFQNPVIGSLFHLKALACHVIGLVDVQGEVAVRRFVIEVLGCPENWEGPFCGCHCNKGPALWG